MFERSAVIEMVLIQSERVSAIWKKLLFTNKMQVNKTNRLRKAHFSGFFLIVRRSGLHML